MNHLINRRRNIKILDHDKNRTDFITNPTFISSSEHFVSSPTMENKQYSRLSFKDLGENQKLHHIKSARTGQDFRKDIPSLLGDKVNDKVENLKTVRINSLQVNKRALALTTDE